MGNYGGSLVLCDKPKDKSGSSFSQPSLNSDKAAQSVQGNDDLDDEIPF